ncbi:MAG: putative FtsK/SpoIIIE family protein [Acidimicrobiales bacterium]|nr:putative FtsK/SpoIIIE family protein [Acidimicrobiales bacterium]
MRVRHLGSSLPRSLSVTIADADATVADLVAALDPGHPIGPLIVDGRPVPAATPLDRAGIADGSELALSGPGDQAVPSDRGPAVVVMVVTAGVDAGRRLPLAAGTHLLGRGPAAGLGGGAVVVADPTVSRVHARLEAHPDGSVTVTDLGSANGTWLAGSPVSGPTVAPSGAELRLGAARLTLEPVPVVATASGGRPPKPPAGCVTRPFHRPPRPPAPTPMPPLVPPPEPEPPGPATPVGVLAVVASLAVGGAMVVVLHSLTSALFAVLGPVLLVAGALDGRRRRRRARQRNGRRRRAELRVFVAGLRGRAEEERHAREARYGGAHEAVAVTALGSTRLWERRPHHPDAYAVRVGVGTAPWSPPVEGAARNWPADISEAVAARATLADAPIGVRLEPGTAVGVVGPPEARRALARSVVAQAATIHGPADLEVTVLAAPATAAHWDWCCWLPHATAREGIDLLAGTIEAAGRVVTALLRRSEAGGPCGLVVIDDTRSLAARRGPVRSVLRAAADPAAGLVPLVLVERPDEVPASCRIVLEVDADGTLRGPPDLVAGTATAVGMAAATATEVARSLARLDDPELDDPGRALPATVGLAALLGPGRTTTTGVVARWRSAGADPPATAVLGQAADGPVVVDLVADGPHALVAGTTGAGKSELLRTLVASLAASSSPDHLTFVLIDFKGGSAFDACGRFPHTTGVVTDLDAHLAGRALRCLEAELRHREHRLREAGAADLGELRRGAPTGPPLPRLAVVVDEFATLAAELPAFVDSLVGIAQRGRSLGVHLVLATQRPAGAVSEHIRSNTALRIALRVHSAADSTDVIGVPDAASLPRHRPGRALVRLGPGELIPLQVARATVPARAVGSRDRADAALVRIAPLRIDAGPAGDPAAAARRAPASTEPSATELDRLAECLSEAWASVGGSPPRCPWPAPLPDEVAWPLEAELLAAPAAAAAPADAWERYRDAAGPGLVVGLADDPDHQRRVPFAWRPSDGPLLAVGLPGSGTTTLAATVVLAAARQWAPTDAHIHVVDLGAGDLVPLAGLPHVGAVIRAHDRQRQRRLVEDLAADLAARRSGHAPPTPQRLLVVDGLGSFHASWDDIEPSGTWSRFLDLLAKGSEVGIHVLATAEGTAGAPSRVVAACRQRLAFRLGDPSDHVVFGTRPAAVPPLPAGRAISPEGPTLVHIARPAAGLAAAVAALAGRWGPEVEAGPGPSAVGVLPTAVPLAAVPARQPVGAADRGGLVLRIGISDRGLAPAHLVLPAGGHALVAGPPRSGRTTCLQTLAASARHLGVTVVALSREPGAWPRWADVWLDPTDADAEAFGGGGRRLVLVDDADLTADDHPVLGELVRSRRAERHVVVAGRSDRLRTLYGHWTREVRADRSGVLLVPDLDVDGELTGARLPRHPPVPMAPGRGWLTGEPEGFVQVALPTTGEGHS